MREVESSISPMPSIATTEVSPTPVVASDKSNYVGLGAPREHLALPKNNITTNFTADDSQSLNPLGSHL